MATLCLAIDASGGRVLSKQCFAFGFGLWIVKQRGVGTFGQDFQGWVEVPIQSQVVYISSACGCNFNLADFDADSLAYRLSLDCV